MIVKPELTEIPKTITRLYSDCSWKNESKHRCHICEAEFTQYIGPDGSYKQTLSLVIEHIQKEHPKFCHKCDKCEYLFVGSTLAKKHKC